jgi:Plavaka transposase
MSWDPFPSRVAFDFTCFHFIEQQTSAAGINRALDLWAASLLEFGRDIPWANAQELYATIDSIRHGQAAWKTYKLCYNGVLPEGTPPRWMTSTFELCTRDSRTLLHQQLETTDFKDKIHYMPYKQFRGDGSRIWSNLMSADWAAKQAVSVLYANILPSAIYHYLLR